MNPTGIAEVGEAGRIQSAVGERAPIVVDHADEGISLLWYPVAVGLELDADDGRVELLRSPRAASRQALGFWRKGSQSSPTPWANRPSQSCFFSADQRSRQTVSQTGEEAVTLGRPVHGWLVFSQGIPHVCLPRGPGLPEQITEGDIEDRAVVEDSGTSRHIASPGRQAA